MVCSLSIESSVSSSRTSSWLREKEKRKKIKMWYEMEDFQVSTKMKKENEKESECKRSMKKVSPTSCSVFSTTVCLPFLLFARRNASFFFYNVALLLILLSICSFIEALRVFWTSHPCSTRRRISLVRSGSTSQLDIFNSFLDIIVLERGTQPSEKRSATHRSTFFPVPHRTTFRATNICELASIRMWKCRFTYVYGTGEMFGIISSVRSID